MGVLSALAAAFTFATLGLSNVTVGSDSDGGVGRAPSKACIGAAAMDPSLDCPRSKELRTTPEFAKTDLSVGLTQCLMWPPYPDQTLSCQFGDTTHPTRRVALFGNSHAGHWTEAIAAIARKNHWQLDTFILGACLSTLDPMPDYCSDIGAKTAASILAGGYDLVVMSTLDRAPGSSAATYRPTLRRLVTNGSHVLVIRDTPAPGDDDPLVADCVAAHPKRWSACHGAARKWIGVDPLNAAAKQARTRRVSTVNVNRYLCRLGTCPAVVGGVIPYRDGNHLTVTFAKSLIPYLRPAVEKAMP